MQAKANISLQKPLSPFPSKIIRGFPVFIAFAMKFMIVTVFPAPVAPTITPCRFATSLLTRSGFLV